MDFGALENDLRVEVKKLPKEFVGILRQLIEKFGADIEKIVTSIDPSFMRHINAAMAEGMMGTLDKDALNETIVRVLKEVV